MEDSSSPSRFTISSAQLSLYRAVAFMGFWLAGAGIPSKNQLGRASGTRCWRAEVVRR